MELRRRTDEGGTEYPSGGCQDDDVWPTDGSDLVLFERPRRRKCSRRRPRLLSVLQGSFLCAEAAGAGFFSSSWPLSAALDRLISSLHAFLSFQHVLVSTIAASCLASLTSSCREVTAFFGRGQKFVVSECSQLVVVPATWQFASGWLLIAVQIRPRRLKT